MEKELDILLTEADGNAGLQVLRSLASRGLRVGVCCHSAGEPAMSCGLAARVFITLPHKDLMNYARQLENIVSMTGVPVVIPVFHPEYVSVHRTLLAPATVAAEDPETIETLDNKLSLHALASDLGIPLPRRYRSADEISSYPVVFRRVKGQGGDSVYFPKDRDALDNLIRTSPESSFIITEFIEGEDISVDALRWGDFFTSGAYRKLLPQGKGVSVLRESIVNEEASAILRSVLDKLDYNGVCGADFRLSPDRGLFLLECNPRFSGGVLSQIASGADLPWMLYQAVSGRALETPVFSPGILTGTKAAAGSPSGNRVLVCDDEI